MMCVSRAQISILLLEAAPFCGGCGFFYTFFHQRLAWYKKVCYICTIQNNKTHIIMTKQTIIEFFDRSDYRSMYENYLKNMPEGEYRTYEEMVEEIAQAVEENDGDIDDAVAIFETMIVA